MTQKTERFIDWFLVVYLLFVVFVIVKAFSCQ